MNLKCHLIIELVSVLIVEEVNHLIKTFVRGSWWKVDFRKAPFSVFTPAICHWSWREGYHSREKMFSHYFSTGRVFIGRSKSHLCQKWKLIQLLRFLRLDRQAYTTFLSWYLLLGGWRSVSQSHHWSFIEPSIINSETITRCNYSCKKRIIVELFLKRQIGMKKVYLARPVFKFCKISTWSELCAQYLANISSSFSLFLGVKLTHNLLKKI